MEKRAAAKAYSPLPPEPAERKGKDQCIALVGLPASGKSAVGAALARRLGWSFVDLDELIVAEAGQSIAEIFRVNGEETFRKLESTILEKATRARTVVLATGGGCVLASGNRELLRERCTVVWLDLSPEAAAGRAKVGTRRAGDSRPGMGQATVSKNIAQAVRPLLADGNIGEKMRALDRIRRPLYQECASIIVQAEDKSPAAIVEELYAALD